MPKRASKVLRRRSKETRLSKRKSAKKSATKRSGKKKSRARSGRAAVTRSYTRSDAYRAAFVKSFFQTPEINVENIEQQDVDVRQVIHYLSNPEITAGDFKQGQLCHPDNTVTYATGRWCFRAIKEKFSGKITADQKYWKVTYTKKKEGRKSKTGTFKVRKEIWNDVRAKA